ncbi:MAG TPA: hypothetical protein VH391_06645 [Solirubrobacterales bacterium]|jgi:hypothetical protein
MAGPTEDRRQISSETVVLGGAAIAAVGLALAGVTGPPYLSSTGVNGWIVVFAAALFAALVAVPFGVEVRLRSRFPDRDARWDRAVPIWGAIGLLVLVVGALVGVSGSFSGDSLAGTGGLLAVVEGGLVVITTLSMLLAG